MDMEGWKKLTVNKRKIDDYNDDGQSQLNEDSFWPPRKISNIPNNVKTKYCNDARKQSSLGLLSSEKAEVGDEEVNDNCDSLLTSILLKNLKESKGYISLPPYISKEVKPNTAYSSLPKVCFNCSVLKSEPVIRLTDDDYWLETKPDVINSTGYLDRGEQEITRDRQNLTTGQRTVKEECHVAFLEKQAGVRDSLPSEFKQANFVDCVGGNSLKEVHEDIGMSDIDFDAECMLPDSYELASVEEDLIYPCEIKNKLDSRNKVFGSKEKTENAPRIVPSTTSKGIHNRFQSKKGYSMPGSDPEKAGKTPKTTGKINGDLLSRNIGSRGSKFSLISKSSEGKKNVVANRIRDGMAVAEKVGFNCNPDEADKLAEADDFDDDVIITKTVDKGKEIVYREDSGWKKGAKHRDETARRNDLCKPSREDGKLDRGIPENVSATQNIMQFDERNQKNEINQRSDSECPVCLMKFPVGWTATKKNQHASECITDDMFMDQNEDDFLLEI